MRSRKFYRIAYKLRALVTLDENDGNVYATAKQLGLPRATLVDWKSNRELIVEQSETLHQHLRLTMSQRLDLVIDQIIESLPEKVAMARLGEAARALIMLFEMSNRVAAEEEQAREDGSDVYEKLARLIEGKAAEMAREARGENVVPWERWKTQRDYDSA